MDEETKQVHITEEESPEEYRLEDILDEYADKAPEQSPGSESLTDRSRRLVLKSMEGGLDPSSIDALGGLFDSAMADEPMPEPEAPAAEPEEESPQPEELQQEAPEPIPEEPEADQTAPAEAESTVLVVEDSADGAEYADADAALEPPETEEESDAPAGRKTTRERFLSPLVALAALLTLRRNQREKAARRQAAEERAREQAPEMSPAKAVRFYGAQMPSLKLRGRLAVILCAIMLYLSFAWYSPALPLTGALKDNIRTVSLLLMILELTVMIVGLDVFTGAVLSIRRRRMGAETLAAASCVLSLLDAVVTAATRMDTYGIPFCAVSAISLTFAVWGAYYGCRGRRTSFRVLTASKSLYTVTGETGLTSKSVALLKSRQSVKGFVRRSEETDFGEQVYNALTPFLMAAALVLGLLASVAHHQPKAAVHCVSILLAASASFSGAICFALPFAAAARKLYQSGAAIAGWSGVRDIGKSRQVVITDADVFPKGTVEISSIRILEGSFSHKVISATASVIAASGNGLAAPFAELVRRNGYAINRVENFEPHDGEGMSAIVNGESVLVGSTGFMNLMGIRLPQKLTTRNSVYTAINGVLVGIFVINYKPVSSVQDALALLLHSNMEPIFATRDFNLTPRMIRQKFRLPTDSFKFPSYTERFRISGAEPERDSRVAAVIAREGMGPLVDAAERGRRAYNGVRAAAIFSAVGSVLGLLILFMLCWAGAFDSATASNVITFMLLWLIPLAVIVVALRR